MSNPSPDDHQLPPLEPALWSLGAKKRPGLADDDIATVARHAARGDEPAKEALITALYASGGIEGFVRKFLSDGSEIENVKQETIIAVEGNIQSFKGKSLSGWIRTIAKRKAVKIIQSQARAAEIKGRLEGERPMRPVKISSLVANRDVHASIVRPLPSNQRRDIGRKIAGYDDNEMAEEAGESAEAVRSRRHRYRNRMIGRRRALDPDVSDGGNDEGGDHDRRS